MTPRRPQLDACLPNAHRHLGPRPSPEVRDGIATGRSRTRRPNRQMPLARYRSAEFDRAPPAWSRFIAPSPASPRRRAYIVRRQRTRCEVGLTDPLVLRDNPCVVKRTPSVRRHPSV